MNPSYPVLPPPATPPRRPLKRSHQIVGEHFESPRRRRRWRHDSQIVDRPDLALLEQRYTDELNQLLGTKSKAHTPEHGLSLSANDTGDEAANPDPHSSPSDLEPGELHERSDAQPIPEPHPWRLIPDEAAQKLYNHWLALIPTLEQHYLGYMKRTQGYMGRPSETKTHACSGGLCTGPREWDVQCLHFNHLVNLTFKNCDCITLPQLLVHNGLFPLSPSQPRLAVSIDLLDFYFALFERSADAITALAGALKSMYTCRGFSILNSKNEPIQDPFRRGLGHAIQWYDALRRRPEDLVQEAMNRCMPQVMAEKLKLRVEAVADLHATSNATQGPNACQDERRTEGLDGAPGGRQGERSIGCRDGVPSKCPSVDADSAVPSQLTEGSCDRILQLRCPACFAGTRFGRDFDRNGGDIHVAIDATFSQRHNVAAGESPWFYEPKYFVPKRMVDAMDARIIAARSRPPRSYQSQVPESALDECEKSYEAADEKKEKTVGTKFDDTGLMALVCRHDIVLFLANVDTPGEQQKYGITLIDHLFSYLPRQATVVVFYDIGCVLDRSLRRFDILPAAITDRLLFATSVMHAYGHQWSCQLVYNPRLRDGLGLTEGEGTERIWSQFCKLIGVTRSSARGRRIWMLDRHADVVNRAARDNLGAWIRTRLKNGVEYRSVTADEDLSQVKITIKELREQWSQQRTAQLLVKNHAPAKLKRELDAVLNLQTELDEINGFFSHVKKAISEDADNPEARRFFDSLCRTHEETISKVEELYNSLNITDSFPEIQGLPLEFIRFLLMARDLKINIRKRAIGTFFEWDKLDRASGGRDQPLGTKLHQQTRKAISKRTPALMTAIRKFNQYCAGMKKLYQPSWNFLLPTELPEELNALREDSSLLSDVWVTRMAPTVPKWFVDPQVRRGIKAVQAKDRCREERIRLGVEADNLCRWYGLELAAVELALRLPNNAPILFLLEQQREELLLRQFHWRTPLVSDLRFQAQTSAATRLAAKLSGRTEPAPVHWVHLNIPRELECEEPDAPPVIVEDNEACLAHDALELICNQEPDRELSIPDDSAAPVCETVSSLRLDAVPMSTIERDLWLSDTNPFRVYNSSTLCLPPPPPNIPPKAIESCIIPGDSAHPQRLWIDRPGLERLHRPTGWLNDDCIIVGSAAILRYLGSASARGNPALFSPYAVTVYRQRHEESLWRVCRQSSDFWNKNLWLFPIHREDHWTLAIVYWAKRRIAYFDSLGETAAFEGDAKLVYSLLHRLHQLATDRGHVAPFPEGKWKAYPLVQSTAPLQHNGYDCGVWILAAIAAVLQGFTSVDLSQEAISEFRRRVLGLVYASAGLVPTTP